MKPVIIIGLCRVMMVLLACSLAGTVLAAIEIYDFDSDEDKARFQRLSDELRCPMCKNTNLSGSGALIANNLRKEVYRMISEGQSDDDIMEFMVQRYGDFVLYNPRLEPKTYIIWFGPLLLVIIGIVVLWRIARKQKQLSANAQMDLDTNEQQKINQLLSENQEKQKS